MRASMRPARSGFDERPFPRGLKRVMKNRFAGQRMTSGAKADNHPLPPEGTGEADGDSRFPTAVSEPFSSDPELQPRLDGTVIELFGACLELAAVRARRRLESYRLHRTLHGKSGE